MQVSQLAHQRPGQLIPGHRVPRLRPEGRGHTRHIGGEIGSGLGHVDTNTYDDPVRHTVGAERRFRQDAADLPPAQHQIVGPLDTAAQTADPLNGTAHGHRRQRRHHRQRVGAQAGTPQHGQVQPQPRRGLEAAAHAAPARRLAVRRHHGVHNALRRQTAALGVGGVQHIILVYRDVHGSASFFP